MNIGLKIAESSQGKPTSIFKDEIKTRKQELAELELEIKRRQAILGELAKDRALYADYPGAMLALNGDREKYGQYQRLTEWMHEHGYAKADKLWVALPVITQLVRAKSFWITNAVAAQWHIKNAALVLEWFVGHGLATRLGETGKDAYKLQPTAKLTAILNGAASRPLQVVK
jgi:hypothetical protein